MKTYKITLEFKSIVTKTVSAECQHEAILQANKMVTDHDILRGIASKVEEKEVIEKPIKKAETCAADRAGWDHYRALRHNSHNYEDEACWADPTWDR